MSGWTIGLAAALVAVLVYGVVVGYILWDAVRAFRRRTAPEPERTHTITVRDWGPVRASPAVRFPSLTFPKRPPPLNTYGVPVLITNPAPGDNLATAYTFDPWAGGGMVAVLNEAVRHHIAAYDQPVAVAVDIVTDHRGLAPRWIAEIDCTPAGPEQPRNVTVMMTNDWRTP